MKTTLKNFLLAVLAGMMILIVGCSSPRYYSGHRREYRPGKHYHHKHYNNYHRPHTGVNIRVSNW